MFQLAWPWVFLALPLPWLLRMLLPPAPPSVDGTLYAPFAGTLAEADAAQKGPSRQRRIRQILAILVWLLLVFAACRPQWLGEPVALPESGRNLMLALDVSGSMESPDLDTEGHQLTRLDVVREVAAEFIERREGDRLGLILFGTHAYLQTPLTFDRQTVNVLLDEAAIGIAGKETAIGDAIGLAVKRLREAPEGEAVLILLTDGANTAGQVSPRQAAELAAQSGLRIYTIGVGGKPMRVRGLIGTRIIDPAADLDERTLTYIADTTGGQYFRATDRERLQAIYQKLEELEPVTGGERSVRPVKALYHWPLGIAFMLTLIASLPGVLPSMRRVSR